MKKGINVFKRDLTILARIVGAVDLALADKKITLLEGITIAVKSAPALGALKTIKQAKAEIMDLDGAEKQELSNHFANEFDLRNDQAENAVEGLVKLAISLSDTFKMFGKK